MPSFVALKRWSRLDGGNCSVGLKSRLPGRKSFGCLLILWVEEIIGSVYGSPAAKTIANGAKKIRRVAGFYNVFNVELQFLRYFDFVERLNKVSFFNVVVTIDVQTTFITFGNFFHIIFETFQ